MDPVIDLMPKTWGILIINEDGTTKYKRRPLRLKGDEGIKDSVARGFFASFVRAIQKRQPAQAELWKEYQRGYEEGENSAVNSRDYHAREVEENYEKIRGYNDLMGYFYSCPDTEAVIEAFKRFMKLNPDTLEWHIDSAIRSLNNLKEKIPSIKEAQKCIDDTKMNQA